MGKLVVDYVNENHKVSKNLLGLESETPLVYILGSTDTSKKATYPVVSNTQDTILNGHSSCSVDVPVSVQSVHITVLRSCNHSQFPVD